MDHFDRRMRLAAEECEYVMPLIRVRLEELYEARLDLDEAALLFRVIWRYINHNPGRPVYPEPFTWSYLGSYLNENGPLLEEKDEEPSPGGVGGDLHDDVGDDEEVKQYASSVAPS